MVIDDSRKVRIAIVRQLALEGGRTRQGVAGLPVVDGLQENSLAGSRHQITIDEGVIRGQVRGLIVAQRVKCAPVDLFAAQREFAGVGVRMLVEMLDEGGNGLLELRCIVDFRGKLPGRHREERAVNCSCILLKRSAA